MSKKQHVKRMRVFAGPNGSGKSSLIKEIRKLVDTGTYINADDIEQAIAERKFLNLADYGLTADAADFQQYLEDSSLYKKAIADGYTIDLSLSDNILLVGGGTHSYEAAIISEYLRQLLLLEEASFSFETVMSHSSKIEIFKQAHTKGYRNYLYFIATDDVDINIRRVRQRVEKGGHDVPAERIRERYTKSLDLLVEMVPFSHRCFILDNSTESGLKLILEVENFEKIVLHCDGSEIPAWVNTYLLDKLGV